jgi:hypothetical protein
MRKERLTNLTFILEQAKKWRPDNYTVEIPRRVSYIDKDMRSDLLLILQHEFEKTWEDMKYQTVMLPIAFHIVNRKSQTFRGKGARFFLKTRSDKKEVLAEDPVSQAFADLIIDSQVKIALRRVDQVVEGCHNAAAKVWWNQNHVRVSTFTPDKVFIAVNPRRDWDPYSAYAVAFERPGWEGLSDEPRFEIWGTRDHTVADEKDALGQKIFHPTLHYVMNKKRDWPINEGDKNPFVDPYSNKPMYPFTWFSDNTERVYTKGGDDLVELNRNTNLGLTYLNHGMSWGMIGIPVYEREPGSQSKLPATRLMSPKHALELPPDIKFRWERDNVQTEPFTTYYEMLIQYHALMNNLSPKSISISEGLPQSGIALRIEFNNLVQYQTEKAELMRPHVIDLLTKMIVVHNYYAKAAKLDPIPLDKYEPEWEAGQLDTGPVDYVELGERYKNEIEYNVSSVDDWAAALHGVDKAEARKLVEANAKRNADIKKAGRPTMTDEEIAIGVETPTLESLGVETGEVTQVAGGEAGEE